MAHRSAKRRPCRLAANTRTGGYPPCRLVSSRPSATARGLQRVGEEVGSVRQHRAVAARHRWRIQVLGPWALTGDPAQMVRQGVEAADQTDDLVVDLTLPLRGRDPDRAEVACDLPKTGGDRALLRQ